MSELETAFRRAAAAALDEDLGGYGIAGDVTTMATVHEDLELRAEIRSRQTGVVCGLDGVAAVYDQLDKRVQVSPSAMDGDPVDTGRTVAAVEGPARAILVGERTALNLLSHLSGVATCARRWAQQARPAQVVETRKTTPGLRVLEKYAVRCGAGANHRMGLFDAVLIKDNHIAAAGSVTAAVRACKGDVEVECDTLEQVREAVEAGAEWILLDNMSPAQVREAKRLIAGRASVEVSGGITFDDLASYAAAGADRISAGALTNAAPALDFGLDVIA